LAFIPLILEFVVIFLATIAISELTWEKVGISIVIAYCISILLAFIIAALIIKGIINDLFDNKPGLFS
jgi:hypothetical protein